jgi:hypothetical protein
VRAREPGCVPTGSARPAPKSCCRFWKARGAPFPRKRIRSPRAWDRWDIPSGPCGISMGSGWDIPRDLVWDPRLKSFESRDCMKKGGAWDRRNVSVRFRSTLSLLVNICEEKEIVSDQLQQRLFDSCQDRTKTAFGFRPSAVG